MHRVLCASKPYGTTHSCWPDVLVGGRVDVAEVIGAALEAMAAGWGHRRIAERLGVPEGTACGWLRRAGVVGGWVTRRVMAAAANADPVVRPPTGRSGPGGDGGGRGRDRRGSATGLVGPAGGPVAFAFMVTCGRLLALPFDDSPEGREEAMVGIDTTLREGFGRSHCLCHGDLGNLDILMLAEEALEETRWRAPLQRRLASLTKHVEAGRWQCGLPGVDVEIPGLMPGLAGIGYGLLRLWSRETVPSVLWLEPPRVRTAEGR